MNMLSLVLVSGLAALAAAGSQCGAGSLKCSGCSWGGCSGCSTKSCPSGYFCDVLSNCQAKKGNGAACATSVDCKDKCVLFRCTDGSKGQKCGPGAPCNSGLGCLLKGRCASNGDYAGAPCDAAVPCKSGWHCRGDFTCAKKDGKLGSGCDAWHPCKEGKCNMNFKCVAPGSKQGDPCDVRTPCGPGFTCDWKFKCQYESADTALPNGYRAKCDTAAGRATNYMGTQRFRPSQVVSPIAIPQAVAQVRDAIKSGKRIKPVGGCVSMSDVGSTTGILMETWGLKKITVFDQNKRLLWLETGVTIADVVNFLGDLKPRLAMPNLGGWTGQTVVGAVTTSTHGSGTKFPPLCDFVHAVHMVAGDGKEYVIAKSDSPLTAGGVPAGATLVKNTEEFRNSVVTMGTLGVVLQVLYEAVPYYYLEQDRVVMPWAQLKPQLQRVIDDNDHVELWANPYTRSVLVTKRNRVGDAEYDGRERSFAVGHAEAVKNSETWLAKNIPALWSAVFGLSGKLLHFLKKPGNVLNAACKAAGGINCVGEALESAINGEADFTNVIMEYPKVFEIGKAQFSKVLCSEPSVPIKDAAALMDLYFQFSDEELAKNGKSFLSFSSMRFSAASEHYMATSHGGARAYLEAPTLQSEGYSPYNEADADERLVERFDVRVLGKFPAARLHFGLQNDEGWDAATIRARYPQSYDKFLDMDAKYDPTDVTNSAFEARIKGRASNNRRCDTSKCFEPGFSYWPVDMPGQSRKRNIHRAEDCQALCSSTKGCVTFSYWPKDKNCHLQDAKAVRKKDKYGGIAGPAKCSC